MQLNLKDQTRYLMRKQKKKKKLSQTRERQSQVSGITGVSCGKSRMASCLHVEIAYPWQNCNELIQKCQNELKTSLLTERKQPSQSMGESPYNSQNYKVL